MKVEVACAAIVAALMIRKRRQQREKKKKRLWVKNLAYDRDQHGVYDRLIEELRLSSQSDYADFLRIDEDSFNELLLKVEPFIKKQDTLMRSSICPAERLAVTLKFLATGDSYAVLQKHYNIPKCTISSIVPEVCQAIYKVLKDDYLKMPSTKEDWDMVAQQFSERCDLPNCIGAIDGRQVVTRVPFSLGSSQSDNDGTSHIILLAVVDANYNFLYVDCNGRVSDEGVLENDSLFHALESNDFQEELKCKLPGTEKEVPYALVAEDIFPSKSYLLQPYGHNDLTEEQQVYNYRLSRVQSVIENAFGILSNRFRVFQKPTALTPNRVKSLILASVALHNYLRSKPQSEAVYTPEGSFDVEELDSGMILPGSWRNSAESDGWKPLSCVSSECLITCLASESNRDELCEYFNSSVS